MIRWAIKRLIVLGACSVVFAWASPAHAVPRPLPTNACIESLMDAGYNYKTARLICSGPQT